MSTDPQPPAEGFGFAPLVNGLIGFCLRAKLVVFVLLGLLVFYAFLVAPFDWRLGPLERDPVAVDAIPDTGDNQQIVFTEWPGRSPQDVEDQVTYPLTVTLLGVPKVKSVRSTSMFGFSSVNVIFEEDAEFYWSRSRILEKLNSLPPGTLPPGANPALGPDATAMGQIFWYTLEGLDAEGRPAGGWELHELRSLQDYFVRYALQAVEGVAEVASIGGYVREYQIDVDPDSMRAYGVTLEDVFQAVRDSNIDVGARTIEVNRVEYVIRGLGFLRDIEDLRQTAVRVVDGVPVTLAQLGTVQLGPAERRGALDKSGAEAVGGVVVARFGSNPMEVIRKVKEKLAEISEGLPTRELEDGTLSQVSAVPFYDRADLIAETLQTLNDALLEQVVITVIVVLLIVFHLRASLVISLTLPISILLCFIGMKLFGVDANIVALSGIAIAIGTIVDMGIVMSENILNKIAARREGQSADSVVFEASSEVGSAVFTAVATTVVGFLPVFFMEGPEGKLFKPLAYTKTFALVAAILVTLTVTPVLASLFVVRSSRSPASGLGGARWWRRLPPSLPRWSSVALALLASIYLASSWQPLGPGQPGGNVVFVILLIGGLIGFFWGFMAAYPAMLRWCLQRKVVVLGGVAALTLAGALCWLGAGRVLAFVPESLRANPAWAAFYHAFPGLQSEFMPSLDEGSFLLMPSTMAHASIGEVLEVVQLQDRAIRAIPEVDEVVGKLGRAESPLDPAPVSMIETVVTYLPEYRLGADGEIGRFRYDKDSGAYPRDAEGHPIPDSRGRPFREWRPHIQTRDDIWEEIVRAAEIPGVTSAPKLQPIETRRVMLQTGMRALIGIKVFGPDLETIESVGRQLERLLKEVPAVNPESAFADRIVGVPYLEIHLDRERLARYPGLSIQAVQDVIETAIGGQHITVTVEGRERYPVRVRYQRELRDSIESLPRILVPAADGSQIPLGQVAEIRHSRGPQMIRSEDTFLVGYVILENARGFSATEAVGQASERFERARQSGELEVPPGVSWRFTGEYENQLRALARLAVILPVALSIIFLILYLQFRSVLTTFFVFSDVIVAASGGFLMLWLYGQPWFLDVDLFGTNLRELLQIRPYNLSVAVWVGFLALFGIASDDGVLIGTYLKQHFAERRPATREEIRQVTWEAALKRNRPAMMTAATTILALLPVLTSTGRGSDVMAPMAIPTFGGMIVSAFTVFVVPTLWCLTEEIKLRRRQSKSARASLSGSDEGTTNPT